MLPFPQLVAAFPGIVWARGVDIAYAGKIHGLAFDETEKVWSARIAGSAAEPYEAWVYLEGTSRTELDGECSCPADKPCKHMAALTLSAYNEAHGRSRIAASATRAVGGDSDDVRARRERAKAEQARFALTSWARMVDGAVRAPTTPASKPSGPRKQLVFVVSIETSTRYGDPRPRVAVDTRAQTLLKNGKGGKATPFSVTEMMLRLTQPRPAWIDEADVALWYRIHSLARSEPGVYGWGARAAFAHRPEAAALFAELLATGRARFASVDGEVLHNGARRAARAVWRMDDGGTQRLTIESEALGRDLVALPLVPLHYLDARTGECGSLELGIPEEIGPWLVAAPAIEPEVARALPDELATRLRTAGLPPPRVIVARRIARTKPTPILRLHARHAEEPGSASASLAYDYGGHEVAAGSAVKAIHRVDGDEVVVIERDRASEAAAFDRLVELGFAGEVHALELPGPARWTSFGRAQADALRHGGWRVEADPDFEWQAIDPEAWYAEGRGDDDDANAWFLELGVVIDGQRIPILPLLVEAIRRGLVERGAIGSAPIALPLPDGRKVAIAGDRLRAMLDVLVELADDKPLVGDALALQRLDVARLDALVGFDVVLAPKLRAVAGRLREGPITAIAAPSGLAISLRDYQLHGLAWLQWLRASELGGILADDMGLGKTAQAIAHLLVERAAGRLEHPALVVAPRSVLKNWEREAQRFAPQLRTAIYHGPGRERVLAEGDADLYITTYALLQRDAGLRAQPWSVVVLDEAQAIKNPDAKVSSAARELVADQRVCMTGTPMENNLGDLWSLMTFANPGLLGTSRQFARWYRGPIEREGDSDRFAALTRRVAPFVLRRTKAQVLAELPPKTEIVLHAVLEGPQRDLYESVRVTMEKRVRDELRAHGLGRSRIVVLDALLKLRQVCCHPPLAKLARAQQVLQSAKLELLLELVAELVAEGRRALVFSQFTSMLAVIEQALDAAKIPWLAITGKTKARQDVVDRFQAGGVPILLVSLKAGGTGLNLTAADTVIHYDPWWNPAVEAQATDRAHRIGQTQKITVYRLICEGTVEERMLELQARKAALVAGLHDSAERRSASGFTLEARDIDDLLAPIDDDASASERAPARGRRRKRA